VLHQSGQADKKHGCWTDKGLTDKGWTDKRINGQVQSWVVKRNTYFGNQRTTKKRTTNKRTMNKRTTNKRTTNIRTMKLRTRVSWTNGQTELSFTPEAMSWIPKCPKGNVAYALYYPFIYSSLFFCIAPTPALL